eukprot:scaffold17594_cov35-Tisochrysis_lutea.AAC.1
MEDDPNFKPMGRAENGVYMVDSPFLRGTSLERRIPGEPVLGGDPGLGVPSSRVESARMRALIR